MDTDIKTSYRLSGQKELTVTSPKYISSVQVCLLKSITDADFSFHAKVDNQWKLINFSVNEGALSFVVPSGTKVFKIINNSKKTLNIAELLIFDGGKAKPTPAPATKKTQASTTPKPATKKPQASVTPKSQSTASMSSSSNTSLPTTYPGCSYPIKYEKDFIWSIPSLHTFFGAYGDWYQSKDPLININLLNTAIDTLKRDCPDIPVYMYLV